MQFVIRFKKKPLFVSYVFHLNYNNMVIKNHYEIKFFSQDTTLGDLLITRHFHDYKIINCK